MSNATEEDVRKAVALGVIDLPFCKARGLAGMADVLQVLNNPGSHQCALSAQFDPVAYSELYPDIAGSGLHPVIHYTRHGKAEGRNALPVFDLVLEDVASSGRPVWIESHDLGLTGAPMALAHLLQGWPLLARNALLGSPAPGGLVNNILESGAKVLCHGQSARRIQTQSEASPLLARCAKLLRQSGAKALIANSFQSWPMVFAALESGLVVHWIIHEPTPDEMRALYDQELFANIVSQMTLVTSLVFVSTDSRTSWQAEEMSNSHVIEKALPPTSSISRESGRNAADCAQDDTLVLSVGTMSPRKGQLDLIMALEHLVGDPIAKSLVNVFVGHNTSDYAADIRSRARKLRAQGMRLFVLPESRTDEDRRTVAHLFAAADVFCMTSRSESRPLTTMEALHQGCPVISTDASGIGELIDDGETGLLYPAGDHAALASRLGLLVSDIELRNKMRATIIDTQDPSAFSRMLGAYQHLLSLPGVASPASARISSCTGSTSSK
ncbi:glycosyltransferase [Leisingera sp. S232]|uniref:glycosyltransferase n=1 Tax=Leisingera sp. S232 TaxID=3415132 RepID=UPI003C79BBB7